MQKLLKKLVVGLLALLVTTQVFASEKVDSLLPHPKAINAFALTDINGKPFTEKSLQGHWSLLFFGFTHCAMVCPTSMTALKQTYEQLQQDHAALPEVVFISVDPERDNLQQIKRYVHTFNPNFTGATGSQAQLAALSNQMGVLYMKVTQPNAKAQDYSIDHTGSILVVNPKGELAAIFTMPHDSQKMTADLKVIMKE